MSVNRAFTALARQSRFHQQKVLRGGGGGAPPPPFSRLPVPTQRVLEESELVWNDGVAPELCIDFDAPHIATNTAIKQWLCGLAFFPLLGLVVAAYDPESTRKADKREYSLPDLSFELGDSNVVPSDEE